MADVFISHAPSDRRAAARLEQELRSRGLSVFRAPSLTASMRPGDRWFARLYDELDTAHAVIVLFSARAAKRPWLLGEAAIADFFGKLIAVPLEPDATPRRFAHAETSLLTAGDLGPRFVLFGSARAEDLLDRIAITVREKQDAAQAERVSLIERLQAPPPATAEPAEQLANALPFDLGAAQGAPEVEGRRSAFVAAIKSLEQASNADIRNAAKTFLAEGRRPDGVARLYAAALREHQPLVWRRFGETALPQAVYAALAGLQRAGLSQRQIDEKLSPQTSAGLLRARFGDRLFDTIGAASFAALLALGAFLVGQRFLEPPEPVVARIPPMSESGDAVASATDRGGPVAEMSSTLSTPDQPQMRPPVRARPVTPSQPHNAAPRPAPPPPPPVAAPAATPPPSAALASALPDVSLPSACATGRLTGPAVVAIRPGDTLWRISQACYADPFAWRQVSACNPQLARRNQSGVSPLGTGDLLYVGEQITLPGPDGRCPS